MARYIDADKLGVVSIDITDLPTDHGLMCYLAEDVDNAPIEDVRPVVRGKWQRITQGRIGEIYRCSKCGRTIEEQGSESLIPIRYPFCHCGADMREVEE